MEGIETTLPKEASQPNSREETITKDLTINERIAQTLEQASGGLKDKGEHTVLFDEEWTSELMKQVLQSSVSKENIDLDNLSADISFKDGKAEVSLGGDARRIRTIKGKEIRGLKKKMKADFTLLNSKDEFSGDVVAFDYRANPGYVDRILQREIRGNELSKKIRDYLKDKVREAGSVKFKILDDNKLQVDFRTFPEVKKEVELPGWLKARQELAKKPLIAEVEKADVSETLSEKKTRKHLEILSEEGIKTPQDFVEMFHQGGKELVKASFTVLDKNKDSEENRETLTALTRRELDRLQAFNFYLRENPPDGKIKQLVKEQVVSTRHLIHLAGEISIVSSKKRAKDLKKELQGLAKRRQKAYAEISKEEPDTRTLSRTLNATVKEHGDKAGFSFDLKNKDVEDLMLRSVNQYTEEIESKGAEVNIESIEATIKDSRAKISLEGRAKVKTGLGGRIKVPLKADFVIENTPDAELSVTGISAIPAEMLDIANAHLSGKDIDNSFKEIINKEIKKRGVKPENLKLQLIEDHLRVEVEEQEQKIYKEDIKPQDVREGAVIVQLFAAGDGEDRRLVLFWWDPQKKTVFGEEVNVNGKPKQEFRYSVAADKEEDVRSLIIKGSEYFIDGEEKLDEVPINSLKIEEPLGQ